MSLNDRSERGCSDAGRGRVARCMFVVSAVSAVAVVGVWNMRAHLVPQHVHAVAPMKNDTDDDGLPDDLELLLGTNANVVDTDGDGYSDAEEVARGSAPNRVISQPISQPVSVSIHGYQRENWIHAWTAVYLEDGDLHSHTFQMGVRVGDLLVPVPVHQFRGGDVLCVLQGYTPGSRLVILDPVVSSSNVQQLGSMSFFATLSANGQSVAAGVLNLASVNGEFFVHMLTDVRGDLDDPAFTFGSGAKGVYKPLTAGPGPQPLQSTPGQICAQTTVIVGVLGAVITEEVIAADCVPGWDAHCSGGCHGTVGSTVKFIDPSSLVGN
jgi:hypothetical protein